MTNARTPAFLQAASHSAQDLRQALAGLITPANAAGALGVRSGVWPGIGQLAVSAPGGLVVRVAPGRCAIQGTEATAGGLQGTYLCDNDTNVDLAVAATAAGMLRTDLVVARVYDAAYSGATNAFALEVVQGVPAAAAPATPATPASAIVLAQINVPAGAAAIAPGNIMDQRPFTAATGGTVVCTSATRPANPWEGMQIWETNTGRLRQYHNGTWRLISTPGNSDGLQTWAPLIQPYVAGTAPVDYGAWINRDDWITGYLVVHTTAVTPAASVGVILPANAPTTPYQGRVGSWVARTTASSFTQGFLGTAGGTQAYFFPGSGGGGEVWNPAWPVGTAIEINLSYPTDVAT